MGLAPRSVFSPGMTLSVSLSLLVHKMVKPSFDIEFVQGDGDRVSLAMIENTCADSNYNTLCAKVSKRDVEESVDLL